MENENNQEEIKVENVPTPVADTSASAEAPADKPAEPIASSTPEVQPAPTPEPVSTPPSSPTNPPTPFSKGSGEAVSPIKNLLLKAKEMIQFRKRKKLEKILELAREKGKITNNNIQKFLRVSDATATRYLSQLVKEGKLTRQGKPKNAFYQLP